MLLVFLVIDDGLESFCLKLIDNLDSLVVPEGLELDTEVVIGSKLKDHCLLSRFLLLEWL